MFNSIFLKGHSFSRKILLVFSIATIIPILSLTIFTNNYLSNTFENEVEANLIKNAKSYGLLTYDKIQSLNLQLLAISKRINDELANSFISDFENVELIKIESISAAGFGASMQPRFSYFRTLGNELKFKIEALHQSSENNYYVLRGVFNPNKLFGDKSANPFNEPTCVFGGDGSVLFCNEDIALKKTALANASHLIGAKERIVHQNFEGNNYLLASWELFLPTYFQSNTWHFVILKKESLALSAIKQFENILIPVSLLFFLGISFFVLKLIDRLLTPLKMLTDATKQLSKGDYDVNIKINTNDEFEELSESFKKMSYNLKHAFFKDKVFSEFERSLLSSMDIHESLKKNLSQLLSLFETNWLVISLVDPNDSNYLESHCIANNVGQAANRYKRMRHKYSAEVELYKLANVIPQDRYKEIFGDLSNELFSSFVWVSEVRQDVNVIGYVLLDSPSNNRMSNKRYAILEEFLEHLSIMYTTHNQRVALINKANFDDLTRLPNRNSLLEHLGKSWRSAKKENYNIALLFIDLDHFKNVNDLSGHQAGNEVLIQVANRLRNCMDMKGELARLSGDEFCILLDRVESEQTAIDMANKITTRFKRPFVVKDMSYFLGTSIGVAVGPADSKSPEHLLEKADHAMFKAKQDGRNRHVLFDSKIEETRNYRLSLERHLHYALEYNEVSVNYQPKISLTTGKLVSVESLARWRQREVGFVRTDEFIALAEESGMINEIGEWILKKACYQYVDWVSKGIELESIAVNVSARQLASKQFTEVVDAVIQETGIPPRCLDLEITESAFVHDEFFITNELNQLNELGVSISIDDFGKEYSSLNYLKKIPFETLKIDREFIMDLEKDKRDQSIVNVIINIGHTLGKKIVAEGIETIEQRDILRAQNCDYGQGYLFSPPLTDIALLEFGSKYINEAQETKILKVVSENTKSWRD